MQSDRSIAARDERKINRVGRGWRRRGERDAQYQPIPLHIFEAPVPWTVRGGPSRIGRDGKG